MGEVKLTIQVKNLSANGVSGESVEVLADTGATLTMLPADILKRAGIIPDDKVLVKTADGRTTERSVGHGWVTVQGRATAVRILFGETNDERLLGLTALEQLGLMVDPVNRVLIPASFNLF